MHPDLGRALADELTAAGITADFAQKNRVSARISWRGAEVFEELRGGLGRELVPFREAFVPSLGVGALVSEFATAQIPLTPDSRRALAALGGLLILQVSAFDKILDSGRRPPDLCFSEIAPRPHRGNSVEALLQPLMSEYCRRLDRLPKRQPALRFIADAALRRMYAAELQSICAPIGRSTWWRKNVLPIVMLGLPAWIATGSFSPSSCARHLMWLSRMGEFFGWVDDCVDYAEDVRLGQANRIDVRLRSISREQLMRTIAAQGKRVLAQWDLANGASPLRSTFTVILWSWIENKPAKVVS